MLLPVTARGPRYRTAYVRIYHRSWVWYWQLRRLWPRRHPRL